MIVTDLEYHLETKLVQKLDLIIKRCEKPQPKKDALLIVEGGEGEGKTNSSVAIAYYIKYKTQREIHLFFRLKNLIQFAKSNKKKIIIWDEPAIDSLSTDWYKETNKDLMRLLMTIRKNRHIFIFNFTKFYKFAEYIVVDRAIGLIHMYSRKEVIAGRFVYIKRNKLEKLYLGYRFGKKRMYKDLYAFGGGFVEVMEKHFPNLGIYIEGKLATTHKDYDDIKDSSILEIGTSRSHPDRYYKKFALLAKLLKEKHKETVQGIETYLRKNNEPITDDTIAESIAKCVELSPVRDSV